MPTSITVTSDELKVRSSSTSEDGLWGRPSRICSKKSIEYRVNFDNFNYFFNGLSCGLASWKTTANNLTIWRLWKWVILFYIFIEKIEGEKEKVTQARKWSHRQEPTLPNHYQRPSSSPQSLSPLSRDSAPAFPLPPLGLPSRSPTLESYY